MIDRVFLLPLANTDSLTMEYFLRFSVNNENILDFDVVSVYEFFKDEYTFLIKKKNNQKTTKLPK